LVGGEGRGRKIGKFGNANKGGKKKGLARHFPPPAAKGKAFRAVKLN